MSDPTTVALIAATPPTIAAIASFAISWHNKRHLQTIHLQLNSRMDEFMTLVRTAALAEGKLEGAMPRTPRADPGGTTE